MSTTIAFDKTPIPANFVVHIKDRWGINFNNAASPGMYIVFMNSIATFLKYQKSKATPHIGLKLLTNEGKFFMGATLDYHAPEGDDDDTGNWTLSFTFNEGDLLECDAIFDSMNDMFTTVVAKEISSVIYGSVHDNTCIAMLFESCVDVLKQTLDSMSNDGSDAEIVYDGIFTASVGFEEGQKFYAITPGEIIKQLIKDDKGNEKTMVVQNQQAA